jgi:MATE family multidrug resistance protein
MNNLEENPVGETTPLMSSALSYEYEDGENDSIEEPKLSTEEESSSTTNSFSLSKEAKLFVDVALPTVIVQFCTFIIWPQCASIVGRKIDDVSLGALSLGSLSGNMTCISIIVGTLSASETLQPRAFGLKEYREVGRLAIRGFIMCILSLIVPMFVLLKRADQIFVRLGQDVEAAYLASEWIRVYVWSVPFVVLFRVNQRFLACQNIVFPCVFGAALGSFVIHPFVLKWAVEHYGFMGSGWAIVVTQALQYLFAVGYMIATGSYAKSTWPGLSISLISEAIDPRGLAEYAKLSVGGVFALSEWWFWEAICFLAGKFGVIELCIHTVTYQLIPIAFMVPLGISIGLNVRMGVLLPVNVEGTKRLVAATVLCTILTAAATSAFMFKYQTWIVSFFTTDEEVVEGCSQIWFLMCVYNFLLWIFCVSRGILNALGLQWLTAANMIAVLWVWTIPAIIYKCIYRGQGFYKMWHMIPLSYTLLNLGLAFSFMTADWHKIGAKIRLDKEAKDAEKNKK